MFEFEVSGVWRWAPVLGSPLVLGGNVKVLFVRRWGWCPLGMRRALNRVNGGVLGVAFNGIEELAVTVGPIIFGVDDPDTAPSPNGGPDMDCGAVPLLEPRFRGILIGNEPDIDVILGVSALWEEMCSARSVAHLPEMPSVSSGVDLWAIGCVKMQSGLAVVEEAINVSIECCGGFG